MVFVTPPSIADPDLGMTVIPVTRCEEVGYPRNREGKCVLGLLLSLRHITAAPGAGQSGGTYLSVATGRYNVGARSGQRQNLGRGYLSKLYDRLLLFADLTSDDGQCFAVILRDFIAARSFFTYAVQYRHPSVGSVYLIEEPYPVENHLGSTSSVPVITQCSRFLPLVMPCHSLIPRNAISTPSQGCTRFFAMHKKQIDFSAVTFVTTNCSGHDCDHQQLQTSRELKCGCFHSEHKNRPTLCFDVSFPDPVALDNEHSDGFILVQNVSSRNTAELFVTESSWNHIKISDWDQVQSMRRQVVLMKNMINENGGWTLVGWVRTGTVNDVSAGTETENLASIHQIPHISYLYPSKPRILKTEEYKSLMLNLSKKEVLTIPSDDEDDDDDEEEKKDDDDEPINEDDEDESSDDSDPMEVPPPRGGRGGGRARGRRNAASGRGRGRGGGRNGVARA